jgi:hypothetical protein
MPLFCAYIVIVCKAALAFYFGKLCDIQHIIPTYWKCWRFWFCYWLNVTLNIWNQSFSLNMWNSQLKWPQSKDLWDSWSQGCLSSSFLALAPQTCEHLDLRLYRRYHTRGGARAIPKDRERTMKQCGCLIWTVQDFWEVDRGKQEMNIEKLFF